MTDCSAETLTPAHRDLSTTARMAEQPNQPSTANIAAACAIIAGVTGYMLGQAKSLGFFGGSPISQSTRSEKEKVGDSEDESSDDGGEDEDDGSTPTEFPDHNEECKMVLVVRTDLGMTKGTAVPWAPSASLVLTRA